MNTLSQIVRGSAQPRWLPAAWNQYTPAAVDSVLRNAVSSRNPEEQWLLFQLMVDTWPRLRKNLDELCGAISRIKFAAAPPDADGQPSPIAKQKADLVNLAIRSFAPKPGSDELGFEDTLYAASDAIAKGLSVLEILWHRTGAGILPRAAVQLHPRHYGYPDPDDVGSLRISPSGNKSDWQEPAPAKFLVATYRSAAGPAIMQGLLRPLAFWWAAANFSAAWFLRYAELFGVPYRVATYDPSRPELKDELDTILSAMAAAAYAVIPAGTNIELRESKLAGDNPHEALLERADQLCDILILGQTLTTDAGDRGTQALGTVHEGIRAERIGRAAWWAADLLSYQLVPHICRLNFGRNADDEPIVAPDLSISEDPDKTADRLVKLAAGGFVLPRDWAYAQLGIPVPAAGEPVLSPPAGRPSADPARTLRDGLAVAPPPALQAALAKLPQSARDHYLSLVFGE